MTASFASSSESVSNLFLRLTCVLRRFEFVEAGFSWVSGVRPRLREVGACRCIPLSDLRCVTPDIGPPVNFADADLLGSSLAWGDRRDKDVF